MKHLLIVDDDIKIVSLLQKFFKKNNYEVSIAHDSLEAKSLLESFEFDLIILDIMMPGETGTEFTISLKNSKFKNIPILLLSALSTGVDRINGLEVGGDDYLTKPFEPKELLLRVEKLINRTNNSESKKIIRDLEYDIKTQQLYKNGSNINLSYKESKIITKLIDNLNKPVSRENLALDLKVNERTIDVMVIRLRSKIENDPKNPQILKTIRNHGYILYT